MTPPLFGPDLGQRGGSWSWIWGDCQVCRPGLRICCVKFRILCEKHKIRNKTRQCMLLRNPTRSHKIRRNPNKTLQCMPFTKSFKILKILTKSVKIQNPTPMYVFTESAKSEQNPNKIPNSKSVRHDTSAAFFMVALCIGNPLAMTMRSKTRTRTSAKHCSGVQRRGGRLQSICSGGRLQSICSSLQSIRSRT